jgi:hypothetical protein
MALAGGAKPSSKMDQTILVRTNPDGTKTVLHLKLDNILNAKAADFSVLPDDILYLPPSTLKAASKVALQAAIGFASQAYIFLH